MNERTRLLHNMSVPPKSVVRYEGLSRLGSGARPGRPGTGAAGIQGERQHGSPVRVELPRDLRGRSLRDALDLLRDLLGLEEALTEPRLVALVNRRAAALELPEGCAVIASRAEHPEAWQDPLAALAVLSKSTDTVWLRAKTPALASALHRDALSLLVPPAFASRLPGGVA